MNTKEMAAIVAAAVIGIVLMAMAGGMVTAKATAKTRYIKSTYISDGAIAVSCSNGGSPSGQVYGGALIISCGGGR